jgi:hypothetical protein
MKRRRLGETREDKRNSNNHRKETKDIRGVITDKMASTKISVLTKNLIQFPPVKRKQIRKGRLGSSWLGVTSTVLLAQDFLQKWYKNQTNIICPERVLMQQC